MLSEFASFVSYSAGVTWRVPRYSRVLWGDTWALSAYIFSTTANAQGLLNYFLRSWKQTERFPVLRDQECRCEFLSSVASGMGEQVAAACGHTELAPEFGEWTLKLWRLLEPVKRSGEGVLRFAMDWLKKGKPGIDRSHLIMWWRRLQPLLRLVVTEGRRADCLRLFFSLHEGGYNDLANPDELLGLVELFTTRLEGEWPERRDELG